MNILEKHVSASEKEFVLRPYAPWYTESVRAAKQEKRKAERKWKKSKLTIDKEILRERQKEANMKCLEAKTQYYNSKIEKSEENSKELFNLANSLLYKEKNEALPTYLCEKTLADQFGEYFTTKN